MTTRDLWMLGSGAGIGWLASNPRQVVDVAVLGLKSACPKCWAWMVANRKPLEEAGQELGKQLDDAPPGTGDGSAPPAPPASSDPGQTPPPPQAP